MTHCRPNYRPWEQYATCCHCAHPLSDNQQVKDALISHNTIAWAKQQLRILKEMATARNLPPWYANEVRRIRDGLLLIPAARSDAPALHDTSTETNTL